MAHARRALLLFGLTVAIIFKLLPIILQRTLIYSPKPYTPEQERIALSKYGLDEKNIIDLLADDKTRLRSYWIPYKDNKSRAHGIPTVLYLHVKSKLGP